MGLIEVASGNSIWRGMDYYENKKVISWENVGKDELRNQLLNALIDAEDDYWH